MKPADAPIAFLVTKQLGKKKWMETKIDRKWSHQHKRKPPTARMLADACAIAIFAPAPIAFFPSISEGVVIGKKKRWKHEWIENDTIRINGRTHNAACSQMPLPPQSLHVFLFHFALQSAQGWLQSKKKIPYNQKFNTTNNSRQHSEHTEMTLHGRPPLAPTRTQTPASALRTKGSVDLFS